MTRPTSHGLLMFGPMAWLMGPFVAFWLLDLCPFDYVLGFWAVYSGLGPFYQLKKKRNKNKSSAKKKNWVPSPDKSKDIQNHCEESLLPCPKPDQSTRKYTKHSECLFINKPIRSPSSEIWDSMNSGNTLSKLALYFSSSEAFLRRGDGVFCCCWATVSALVFIFLCQIFRKVRFFSHSSSSPAVSASQSLSSQSG